MENETDRLSNPQKFLWRMIIFLIIAGFVALILYSSVIDAFLSNPALNGLILFVLLVGIAYIFRQIIRLFPEVKWVNGFRVSDPGLEVAKPPVLLAPMAMMLRDRVGETTLSAPISRSLLDSIAVRLDESREIARYVIGLLVFLGLLGTFWGLLETVTSVASTINSLDTGSGNANLVFEDLKAGLQAPLQGMGTAFSSSLFGLAGSLILGFLDLQAGQAQNRFYTELEDWLSEITSLSFDEVGLAGDAATSGLVDVQASIDRLSHTLTSTAGGSGSITPGATAAMGQLAEGVQALVQHMRAEQQLIREWVESQSEQQAIIKQLLQEKTPGISTAEENNTNKDI